MRIDKSGIDNEDKFIASRTLNQLRAGQRVFGNPAEGLKNTLKNLEEQNSKIEKSKTEFSLNDKETKAQIAMLKAGITGEEATAEYIEKIIKHDERLDGVVVFASLSYDVGALDELGHIPDTDFIAVYGNNIMILDSKNLRTDPDNPVFLQEGGLRSMNGFLIDEINPSTYFWRDKLASSGIDIESISEYIVIYNKNGASILKNVDYHKSVAKPVHISGLLDVMLEWVEGKENVIPLRLLTALSKGQIKKPKSNMDLRSAFSKFKI